MSAPRDVGLRGLYIHVPFCSIKCFYCDFTAFAGQRNRTGRYLRALAAESRSRHRPVDTLYVGGGTPSELSAEEMDELLCSVEELFGPVEGFLESTFEANPESLSEEKMDVLRSRGVGRLSLGLQSADDRLLRSLGRRHGWEDFCRVYAAAKARGFAVNVDLMVGLPGQSPQDARRSLESVLSLDCDHLSLYCLQVEDRTLLARRGFQVDEDLVRDMFEGSIERLKALGYHHYEISNFARPGFESIHNRIYWRNEEYLGLGCGASSYLDGQRTQNLDRLEAYCAAIESGRSAVLESESLSPLRRMGETVLLGLRQIDGMALTPEMWEAFEPQWARLLRRGWIAKQDDTVKLAGEGLYLANRVFEEFVQ